jgi:hypothetical protein
MEKSLVQIVETTGLEQSKAQIILTSFTGFFEQAKEWETKAKALVITDPSQKKEMQLARDARLALKEIRVNAEKARKELKEQSLREGKAIDGIANVIKALIVPIEEYLEKQEKFVENIEAERKARIYAERVSQIQPFIEDINLFNIKEMSDEAFAKLLEGSKLAFDARQQAIKKAEEERIAKEKAEAEERERTRLENEKLKKEAEVREKAIAEERKKADEEKKKLEAQQAEERTKREKVERELKERKEAEEKAKREAEAKAKKEAEVKAEAERQSRLAPEKDKIFAFAENIKKVDVPRNLSEPAQRIVNEAEKKLLAISQEIKNALNKI